MKAEKNTVEKEGMRNAHIRDAAAFCEFLSILEEDVSYKISKILSLLFVQIETYFMLRISLVLLYSFVYIMVYNGF